jgi:hypothetical protein
MAVNPDILRALSGGGQPQAMSAPTGGLGKLAQTFGSRPSGGVQVAGSFDATPDYERALKFVTNHGADAAMLDPQRMFVRLPVMGADGSEMNEDHVVNVGPDGSVDWKMLKSILGY